MIESIVAMLIYVSMHEFAVEIVDPIQLVWEVSLTIDSMKEGN